MPQQKFDTIEEFLGYNTSEEILNTDARNLVSGSQNVIIDRQRKVKTRGGYTRLGAANSALTAVRSAITWSNSSGVDRPLRVYDDELEVYLGTVDTVAVNAWTRVMSGLSTTEILRFAVWWDTGENIDQILFVQGDDNHYKWGGGVAVISSVTANTIVKKGTNTWAQSRFYTTGSKTIAINGTVYTYTGGETTTTLTGVTPDPSAGGVVEDNVATQEIRTHANEPASGRDNHTIAVFENQVFFGSDDDNEIYVTQNDDTTDTTFSSPRVAGEGALLTLDGTSKGFGIAGGKFLMFAGLHSIWKALYTPITVSTTLAELLSAKKLDTGSNQGALSPDAIVQIGDQQLVYLTNEPALRLLDDPDKELISDRRTLSNPIKPDFDAETWTNAWGIWHRNAIYLTAPTNGNLYILEFIEDAKGKTRNFWQPPQILPVRSLFVFGNDLHCGSNSIAETYQLFDGLSDTATDDSKIPIHAIAKFAYRSFDRRGGLKNFDEYYFEGEIQRNTVVDVTLNYGWAGTDAQQVYQIDGDDDTILESETFGASLGQIPLGQNPLSGIRSVPADAIRFEMILEVAKEDFSKFQLVLETNDVDRFWSLTAQGPKVQLSKSRNIGVMV